MGVMKYLIEDYIGKVVGTATITGNTRKQGRNTQWEFICGNCGSIGYRLPHQLFCGKYKKCSNCRADGIGKDSPAWKGTSDIPATILSSLRANAKRGTRTLAVEITLDDLQEVFDEQEGLCVYTGIPLYFTTSESLGNASVDRIDSSLGYIRGNIQFVEKRVNTMKWNLSKEEFLDLCSLISERRRWV